VLRKISLGLLLMLVLAAVSLSRPMSGITVSISPTNKAITVGGDQTFTATVSGSMTTTAVTWAVNGIAGGNSTLGTVDSTGHYKAPSTPPAGYTVTVSATSVEDPTVSASTTVYVIWYKPVMTGLNPSSIPLGAFSLSVTGSSFVPGAQVLWNGSALQTTYNSSSSLTATGNATANASVQISVTNGPGSFSSPVYILVVGTGGSTTTTNNPPPPPPPSPITVNVSPATVTIAPGASQQFQATVLNTSNQSVSWLINGKAVPDPGTGSVDPTGLYTAPAIPQVPGVYLVSAVSAANGASVGTAVVTVRDPQAYSYARFLNQATFGPTPQSMAHISQIGIPAFIDEQFAMPESPMPMGDIYAATNQFYFNLGLGQDQLRQRVIYALSEIFVIARNKNVNGDEIIPWLQILSKDAFGNYLTLLKDVAKDASMGHYLDLANSGVYGGAANENFPREVMQLFSIGLEQMNIDGSYQLDALGNPIPTYTQFDVQQLAKALTGWTYDNATHTVPNGGYYAGPMVPYPAGHNTQSKTVLGVTIPANQSVQQDFDSAMNIIFNHPNVGPFIATRLIRALVTSNPSPAYITAVAQKFNDNGSGVRGDMQAVIREILTNPEARNDNPPPTFGRLRTPVQFLLAFDRQMNYPVATASGFNYLMYGMDEGILDPPSVFGHYSPLFRIPQGGGLFGPEFQIFASSDAVNRANFLYGMLYQYPSQPLINAFINLGGNPTALINAVDNALLYGQMLSTTRTAIQNSLAAMPDNNQRAIEAIYLTSLSAEYQVQH